MIKLVRKTAPKRPRSKKAVLRGFVLAAAVLFIASVSWTAYAVSALDVSRLENPLPEPTTVLDRYDQPASQLSASKIVPVPLAQMPLDLRNAVIATEDRRFYEHIGVDLWAIARATIRDVATGSMKEGGSTITQQLAKNMFLTSDKTWSRKLKEAGYAVKLHFAYTKDEILELYLNTIYFGQGCWGVQCASRQYFGKDVQALTLEECAVLAGLPKAPSAYDPIRHPEEAAERRNTVLALMRDQHFISDAQYAQASAGPITLSSSKRPSLKGQYPSYTDYVIEEASELYGFTEQQLLTGGLLVYTELDPAAQQAAEEAYRRDDLFPKSPDDQPVQSGAAVLDPHTGGIAALIGGRGDAVYRGFNRATQLKRQPGSAFKPIAVYGPALERGWTPESLLYDGELNIAGYRPRDWDGGTRGQVTMREALLRSWNIPAVWLLNEIGLQAGIDYAGRAGIPLGAGDRSLSIALGGLFEGVSPLQMAQAYGAFANGGELVQAHAIRKITTKDGHVLVEAAPTRSRVTAPEHAYTMTRLLQAVVAEGGGRQAALPRPTAGKSGTTQLPDLPEFAAAGRDGARDAWFVGYTPEYAAAVWVGYDKTDRSHYLTTSGGAVPAVLFREILQRALNGVPVQDFAAPPGWQPAAGAAAPGPGGLAAPPAAKPEQPAAPPGQAHGGGPKGKKKGRD
ncbi:transglycosylase domain-containing protein [Paenibacillus hamazuiensis]|uniref:transglycosylase domain-containing protein n=1 Tax=Paenibacillus hamazuiensis TaxID=2936508 RepID=UPI00200D0D3D|nr:PBP1A family penicillin-binding protein [Paenibacillus hamazuiensis]